MDDGDPHYMTPKSTDPNMVLLRGNVVQSFHTLVSNARDMDLDDTARALDQLRQRDRRLYQMLMGCTLLNDIITSVYDEHAYRNQQGQRGGAA